MNANIRAPQKLSAQHELSEFASGEPFPDEWLRRRRKQLGPGIRVI